MPRRGDNIQYNSIPAWSTWATWKSTNFSDNKNRQLSRCGTRVGIKALINLAFDTIFINFCIPETTLWILRNTRHVRFLPCCVNGVSLLHYSTWVTMTASWRISRSPRVQPVAWLPGYLVDQCVRVEKSLTHSSAKATGAPVQYTEASSVKLRVDGKS